MRTLIEISKIVTKKRISKIEIFDKSLLNKKESKFNEFYEGLVNNDFKTDEEAAEVLYQTTPLDDKYRQLKSRFTKRLMNTLFFLDANDPSFSNYHSAYYTCNKNWALIRILLSSGARNAATKLAAKTLHVAQNFRFTDIILNCSRILMTNSSLAGKSKEYEQYAEIANKAMVELGYEMQSEEMYQRLTIGLTSSGSVDEERARIAGEYLEKVRALTALSDSCILHFNMYQIWILYLQFKGGYQGTIEVCEQAEAFLDKNEPFRQKVKQAGLALTKINCYLQLRDYENGRTNADRCLELFTEGSNNWFVFLEVYFLLAMHTKNYINAAGIYLKVINHPRFQFTAPERQEKWKIFEAYINYIFETEGLNKDLLFDDGKRKFRLLKFLNEVPHFSKDKKGFNVAILVLQILYMLEKGDYTGIINRSEALNVYCSRYLRKDDSFRSNCFLKMLLTMEKEDFKYERTRQMAMKFYKKMTEEVNDENIVHEWEIIPYETLWDMVLNRLRNKVAAA